MTNDNETMTWVYLDGEIRKTDYVLQQYDAIIGYIEEIGNHLCNMDESGIDIQPHCEAVVEFEDAIKLLRAKSGERWHELLDEKERRAAKRGQAIA